MTDKERRTIKEFDARVRQLILQYKVLQQENSDLYAELERKENSIDKLQAEVSKIKSDYDNLKLAKMIEISDADFKDAKQRITKLVRDVNKCIAMLSTEQEESN